MLQAKEGITTLEADFTDNTITVFFPKGELTKWPSSNRVGYSNKEDWNNPRDFSFIG